MALLLILLILTLGYTYTVYVPSEHNKLKRSDGWESYVYLAKHGLTLLILPIFKTLVATFFASLLLVVLEFFLTKFGRTIHVRGLYESLTSVNMLEVNAVTIFIAISIAIFMTIVIVHECYAKILENKDSYKHLDQLRKEDSVLNIVIEAMIENKTVKISLKSRKIYVGMIQSEQFETLDLDTIVIIPFISGYRDDKLRIIFDCNYISVYEKNGILPPHGLDKEHLKNLDSFRLAIKMEEVESISLFSAKYYQQFEFKKSSFLTKLKKVF